MTANEYLKKRARIAYVAAFVPYLPGLLALSAALFWRDTRTNTLAAFLAANWWTFFVVGGLASFACMAVGVRLLLCPFCGFRLSKAGAGPVVFLGGVSPVKHCPNCAASFSQALPGARGR